MSMDRIIKNRAGGDLQIQSPTGSQAMIVAADGSVAFGSSVTFSGGTTGVTATAENVELNIIDFPNSVGSGGGLWTETDPSNYLSVSTTSAAGDLPLAGIADTAIKITGTNLQAENTGYIYTTLTMPEGLKNKKLKVEFYMRPLTGFAASSDAWKVSVYSGSTRMSLSTDSSGATYLPNTTGKFVTTFDADSSSTYTLRFAKTAGASSASFAICNVIVGPGIQPQGAVVGDWMSYTPSMVGNGNKGAASLTGKYRRVGNAAECYIYYNSNAVASGGGSTPVTFSIPSGLTIDSTQFTNGSPYTTHVGSYSEYNMKNSGQYSPQLLVTPHAANNVVALVDNGTNGYVNTDDLNIARTIEMNIRFTVPIAEWSGSGTVNLAQNDVEYLASTSFSSAAIVYGPSGALLPTTTPSGTYEEVSLGANPFLSPVQTTDSIVVEIQRGGVGPWVLPSAIQGVENLRHDGTNYIGLGIYYTGGLIYLIRGKYGVGTTSTWASMVPNTRFRVRKTSAGAAVGFGIVQPGVSAGLVSASGVPGNTTGNAIAAGYVGENKTESPGAVAFTAGQTKNVASVTLGKGQWDISGHALVGSGSGLNSINLGISLTTGSLASAVVGVDRIDWIGSATYNTSGCLCPRRYIITSDNTPVYLVVNVNGGNASVYATINATRVV